MTKYKVLGTGTQTPMMQQRETQTPVSSLLQDHKVNMGLIYSWKILETDVGLSLDAESYFILESQKNISPPEVPMSGLRGKIKTSTSQGDFL